ncbi:MAG TPA: hypothetical protein VF148_14935 [Acidimicrobiia bacterium]
MRAKLSSRLFSVARIAAVATLPVPAILIEKTLFVIEGPSHPAFQLYHDLPSSYFPSWVELSSVIGAFSILVLFFLMAAKALPLIEIKETER